MKRYILSSLLLMGFTLHATESTLKLRNREAGSVGYTQGYSTIDYLLTHNWQNQELLFNLRGHVFNDGKLAANGGFGFRQALNKNKCLIGGNLFYDLRESNYIFSQQVGAGLEFLSKRVDVRLNGYLPIGEKSDFESKSFTGFASHSILVQQKVNAALPSAELEVGSLFEDHFYIALSPYYLFDKQVRGLHLGNAWGGRARVEIDLGKYLSVGGILTHDRIFNTKFQGYLSFNIPLGKRDPALTSAKRNLRRVPIYRNEIIPMEKKKRITPLYVGDEESDYVNIVFVNNAFSGSSDGSFEAPFTSLKEAGEHSDAGDIIYVYPGDDAPYLMDADFVLKPDQMLVSSSTSIEVEEVLIPPTTPGHDPVIFIPPAIDTSSPTPPPAPLDGFRMLEPWEYIFGRWDEPSFGSGWDGGGHYDTSGVDAGSAHDVALVNPAQDNGEAGPVLIDDPNINLHYDNDLPLGDGDIVHVSPDDANPDGPDAPDNSVQDGDFDSDSLDGWSSDGGEAPVSLGPDISGGDLGNVDSGNDAPADIDHVSNDGSFDLVDDVGDDGVGGWTNGAAPDVQDNP